MKPNALQVSNGMTDTKTIIWKNIQMLTYGHYFPTVHCKVDNESGGRVLDLMCDSFNVNDIGLQVLLWICAEKDYRVTYLKYRLKHRTEIHIKCEYNNGLVIIFRQLSEIKDGYYSGQI